MNEETLEEMFNEFISERVLNLRNPYLYKEEENNFDMTVIEERARNALMIASYKRGFADAIRLLVQ